MAEACQWQRKGGITGHVLLGESGANETAALNYRVMDGFKVAEVHTDDKAR